MKIQFILCNLLEVIRNEHGIGKVGLRAISKTTTAKPHETTTNAWNVLSFFYL